MWGKIVTYSTIMLQQYKSIFYVSCHITPHHNCVTSTRNQSCTMCFFGCFSLIKNSSSWRKTFTYHCHIFRLMQKKRMNLCLFLLCTFQKKLAPLLEVICLMSRAAEGNVGKINFSKNTTFHITRCFFLVQISRFVCQTKKLPFRFFEHSISIIRKIYVCIVRYLQMYDFHIFVFL